MEIIDDGVGFDVEAIAIENKETWGLLGMQERATLLGGQFSIISDKGKGTQVSITIPSDEIMDEEVFKDDSIVTG